MCSIIGASSKDGQISFNDMKILFLQGEGRGGHACGFTNGQKCIKMAVNSFEFVENIMQRKDFPRDNKFFIGHTRYATIGKQKDHKNAHPFGKEKLIGVHNGSIFNHEDLALISQSEAEVDSEVIYDCINKFGFKKTLPLLSGIMTLVWYVPKKDVIYIYRNGRPLVYGRKDGVLFWASEKHYLKSIGCDRIVDFNEHTLYQIRDGKIIHSRQLKKKLKPSLPNINQQTNRYIKRSTLDIFSERVDELKSIKNDHINNILKEKEEKKKKEEKKIIKNQINRNEEKEHRSVCIYRDTTLCKPPMYAKLFLTESSNPFFVWFDEEQPYHLCTWEKEFNSYREYDLSIEEDHAELYDHFASISTEIFDWIQETLLNLEEAMKVRNELFEENNQTDIFKYIIE